MNGAVIVLSHAHPCYSPGKLCRTLRCAAGRKAVCSVWHFVIYLVESILGLFFRVHEVLRRNEGLDTGLIVHVFSWRKTCARVMYCEGGSTDSCQIISTSR
jgi:hypothetical protein